MYIVTSEFTHLSNFIFAQQDFRCCADTRPGESNLPKIGENWKRRGRKVEMQGPLLGIIVTKKLEKIYIHINEIWLRCFVSRYLVFEYILWKLVDDIGVYSGQNPSLENFPLLLNIEPRRSLSSESNFCKVNLRSNHSCETWKVAR